jgi:hypothetical protein
LGIIERKFGLEFVILGYAKINPMTRDELRKDIDAMLDIVDEQLLHIIHQLLEREVQLAEFELSEEDLRIIEQRREEMRSGKVKGIPHAEAMAALKAKFKK